VLLTDVQHDAAGNAAVGPTTKPVDTHIVGKVPQAQRRKTPSKQSDEERMTATHEAELDHLLHPHNPVLTVGQLAARGKSRFYPLAPAGQSR
jgi:hypothetical protein